MHARSRTTLLHTCCSLLFYYGVVADGDAAGPRFGVAVTLANNASVAPRLVQQQLCRLRGMVLSLRRVGFAGDIVCQTAGGWMTSSEEVANTLQALCDRVLQLSVPGFDAGPAEADTNSTIEYYRANGRVPPPRTSQLQQRTDGAMTSVKFHAWRVSCAAHSINAVCSAAR